MAQMTTAMTTERRIEVSLDVAFGHWERVRFHVTEWDTLDPEQQLSFIEEWTMVITRLKRLDQDFQSGLMSSAQRKRYEALMRIVDRWRPAAERMIAR